MARFSAEGGNGVARRNEADAVPSNELVVAAGNNTTIAVDEAEEEDAALAGGMISLSATGTLQYKSNQTGMCWKKLILLVWAS